MPNGVMVASDLEILVHAWLSNRRIPFEFQSQLIGGFVRSLGDAVVDFLLVDLNIVLRVQGEYWHSDITETARDRIQRANLEMLGYIVVDLWEDDLKTNLDYVMNQAIQGRQVALVGESSYGGGSHGAYLNLNNFVHRPSGGVSSGSKQTYTMPDVRTDTAIRPVAYGTLLDCGAEPCQVCFEYSPVGVEAALLSLIFPWRAFALLNAYNPNISLDFACMPTSFSFSTAWQTGKVTGDAFNDTMVLTNGVSYGVRAVAKNTLYTDRGEAVMV